MKLFDIFVKPYLQEVSTVAAKCGAEAKIQRDTRGHTRLPYRWEVTNKAGNKLPDNSEPYWYPTQTEAARGFLRKADGRSNF